MIEKISDLSINCQGQLLSFEQAKVMGILNITPDSFYEASRATQIKDILCHIEKMVREGVDIVDIGAMSSRPGAKIISAQEEISRIKEPLEAIFKEFPKLICSIDTVYPETATFAVENGISIINDISGDQWNQGMFEVIAKLQVPYILMHNKGKPQDMQNQTDYTHLMDELVYFFSEKITKLQALGVNDILIDPGFGFAKTLDQNFELLKKLEVFSMFDLPILVGLSRKSMLYNFLDIEPSEALNATSIAHFQALINGANLLRTHDVKEAKECILLYDKMNK